MSRGGRVFGGIIINQRWVGYTSARFLDDIILETCKVVKLRERYTSFFFIIHVFDSLFLV